MKTQQRGALCPGLSGHPDPTPCLARSRPHITGEERASSLGGGTESRPLLLPAGETGSASKSPESSARPGRHSGFLQNALSMPKPHAAPEEARAACRVPRWASLCGRRAAFGDKLPPSEIRARRYEEPQGPPPRPGQHSCRPASSHSIAASGLGRRPGLREGKQLARGSVATSHGAGR